MKGSEHHHRLRSNQRKVFYLGNFLFPDGDAGAHRVHGIGNCLRDAGFEVVFLGAETAGRPQDMEDAGPHRFNGFSYHPAGNAGTTQLRRFWRLWHTHLSGLSTMSRLRSLCDESAVAVFAYQPSALLLAQLRTFCGRHRLALIADVVEWYESSQFTGGRMAPVWLDNEVRMRWAGRWVGGVIAISRYLEQYFATFGVPVLRVPVITDVSQLGPHGQPAINSNSDVNLRLAFVGTIGSKDLVENAVWGLRLLGKESDRVEMVLVGPTRRDLASALGEQAGLLEEMGSRVRITGRLPHVQALEALASADFSVLLRPERQFTQAGFPTKLVETLAMGVPPICNLTSDIGLYVLDGLEGLVLDSCLPQAFAAGIRRAIAMPIQKRTEMRVSARKRAEVSFDFRNWTQPLRVFLEDLIARCGTTA